VDYGKTVVLYVIIVCGQQIVWLQLIVCFECDFNKWMVVTFFKFLYIQNGDR
jgi:hypothetical protein